MASKDPSKCPFVYKTCNSCLSKQSVCDLNVDSLHFNASLFSSKASVRVEDEVLIAAYSSVTLSLQHMCSSFSADQDILTLCTTNKEYNLIKKLKFEDFLVVVIRTMGMLFIRVHNVLLLAAMLHHSAGHNSAVLVYILPTVSIGK